jgi:hypothetical protein
VNLPIRKAEDETINIAVASIRDPDLLIETLMDIKVNQLYYLNRNRKQDPFLKEDFSLLSVLGLKKLLK